MAEQCVVGDIGGTNARLAVAEISDQQVTILESKIYPSREYDDFVPIMQDFVAHYPGLSVAAIGVAGPVVENQCRATNLPWHLIGEAIAERAALSRVQLLNDLEIAAWGLDALDDTQKVTLQTGQMEKQGNQSVIAAGTGLGQAGLVCLGDHWQPFASEGSHADFAPAQEIDVRLFNWLQMRFGHVSWERVVSGPGLANIFLFLLDQSGKSWPDWLNEAREKGEAPAAITQKANAGDPLAEQAMMMFVRFFGAEAGNHALKIMSTGGVFLAGGISPKIRSWLEREAFLEAFKDKGRMQHLMERMPVHLVLEPQLALKGAGCFARQKML